METMSSFKCLKIYLGLGILVLFNMTFTVDVLNAQTSGKIVGRITDANTGEGLAGANLQIEGTYYGAASDRFGKFLIQKVPFGSHTLVVSYIGYEEYTSEITISATEPVATHNVVMKVSALKGEAIVVEGLREGQMKALSQQRTAPNIKNVVAREQMAKFPDYNAAEVVKRVPGVAVERALGEGRYVLIRGTEPRLSNLTVNGQTLASSRRKERYSQLDIVGSNQMASMEVIKALTPDMEGNAIGGTVNIITRSAFDYVGRRLFVSGAAGYPDLRGKAIYQGQMNYSDKFGEKKNIGISITANYDRSEKETETTKYNWGNRTDQSGNTIPFALRDFRTQPTRFVRTRYGLGLDLEYQLNSDNRFFVRGTYNQFDDDGVISDRYRIRVDKGDYIDKNTVEGARLVRQTKNRLEALLQTAYSAGGVHQFGDMSVDYTFAYSYGEEMHPDELAMDFAFSDRVDLDLDLSDPIAPQWKITNMDNNLQYDPSQYTLDGVEYAPTTSTNNNLAGSANFMLPYSLADYPSKFKIGAKWTRNNKDRGHEGYKYSWTGADDVLFDRFLEEGTVYENFADGNYIHGPVSERQKLYDFYEKEKGSGLEETYDEITSKGNTFDATENVYAGYLMTTNTFGKLTFLGGVRYENTNLNYDANAIFYDTTGAYTGYNPVNEENSYDNILPMVHLRYGLSKMTNLRIAVTRTISRPNYWDVAPRYSINDESETIGKGNSELVPTTATNFDLMGEHYFASIGVASAGIFYKKLNDIIYGSSEILSSGPYAGYNQVQPINGGEASLYGFELNWNQQFTFLPGFWSGFGLYANYAHTWAKTELTDREGFLPGQAGDTGNLALIYEKYGFSSRLSLSFQGKFIMSIGSDKDNDQYVDDYAQLDFSANQRIMRGLDAFLEVVNINGAAQVWYLGDESRPLEKRIYSWWTMLGLRWSLLN
jgi:TonB-dependent receptor